MRLPFILVLAAVFNFSLCLSAQPVLHFFSDTVHTGNPNRALATVRENEFIYVGGQAFDGDGYAATPSVIKLDTAGNTLWSYTLNKEIDEQTSGGVATSYGNGAIKKLLVDATAVYAYFEFSESGSTEIWRLD